MFTSVQPSHPLLLMIINFFSFLHLTRITLLILCSWSSTSSSSFNCSCSTFSPSPPPPHPLPIPSTDPAQPSHPLLQMINNVFSFLHLPLFNLFMLCSSWSSTCSYSFNCSCSTFSSFSPHDQQPRPFLQLLLLNFSSSAPHDHQDVPISSTTPPNLLILCSA